MSEFEFFRKSTWRLENNLCLCGCKNYNLMDKNSFVYRVFDLYYDGFRRMKLGRSLWAIILIKLFIMFAILKFFFFPNFLKEKAARGSEADYVSNELVNRAK